MDCNMPLMNGYIACQKLKKLIADQEVDNMRVIACTADITQYNYVKCSQNKFDAIVYKPVYSASPATLTMTDNPTFAN